MIITKTIGSFSAILAVIYLVLEQPCQATYFLVLAVGMLMIILSERGQND